MSEIVYCYTCNRGQPLDPAARPYRVCSVCKNDELGEPVDPALTGGRVPVVPAAPPVKYVQTTETARSEVVEYRSTPRPYTAIAADVAAVVERKNKAYGDSFTKVTRTLEDMFPDGIPVEAYANIGGIVRTLDKLFRVATDRDGLEENPWGDIAGYALLAVRRVEQDKGRA